MWDNEAVLETQERKDLRVKPLHLLEIQARRERRVYLATLDLKGSQDLLVSQGSLVCQEKRDPEAFLSRDVQEIPGSKD